MADIATLGLKIDASGAIKGITDADAKLIKLGDTAAAVGKKFALAFGAAAAGGLLLVLKNTVEQEKQLAQLEARIRSTGGAAGFTGTQLAGMAADLQKVSTFGDEAIMSMQSVLLTFTKVRGDEFKGASQAILDMSVALGTDLRSAALQVGKALNDPIAGVTALSRAGVQLTDAQKATIKSLVDVGDVAGAQRIILKELEGQMGGSANAARNTLGGALASLKNAFGDLFEVPGLVKPITAEIQRLTAFLSDPATVAAASSFIQSLAVNFAAAANAILEVVGLIASGIGGLAGAFGRLSGPGSPLNKLARGMDSFTTSVVNGQLQLERITAGFASNGRAGETAATQVRGLAEAMDEVAESATNASKPIGELANQYGLFIKEIKAAEAAAKAAAKAFPELAIEMQKVQEVILPPEGAQSAWSNFGADLYNLFRSMGEWAKESGQQIADALLGTFRTIAQRGKATLGDLFATLGAAGVGGTPGGTIFSGLAIVTDAFKAFGAALRAERDRIARELEAYRAALAGFADSVNDMLGLTAFESGIDRLSRQFSELWANLFNQMSRDAQGVLTTPSGGRMTAEQAREAARNTRNVGLAQELLAYADELDRLNGLFKVGAAELERRRKVEIEAFEASVEERELRAMGRDEEADAIRQRIQEQKELNEALRLGIPPELIERLEALFELERKRVQELEDAARDRTLAGLDVQIARAGGDEAEARRLERELTLAGITDELIRAKYEELYAVEDAARAAQEVAEALALLQTQARQMEDLEVRRAQATGDALKAEELRFQFAQQRELQQAEADLEANLVTQEFVDALREVLQLEAGAFAQGRADRDAATAASEAATIAAALLARDKTLAGLDVQIAESGGDRALAERLRRDIQLAEVTDELVRAKYEELYAVQDAAKAAQELADAMDQLERQNRQMEDLEVRRLVATGASIEAEELRFQLSQERELRQAERDLALGNITVEIFEKLRDILSLEASAFAARNDVGLPEEAGPQRFGAAGPSSTGGAGVLSLASASAGDIDRVVGELTSIRIRTGQTVQLLTQLIRGGGIAGAVNTDLQVQTNLQARATGRVVVS
jgi:hypothetical protein